MVGTLISGLVGRGQRHQSRTFSSCNLWTYLMTSGSPDSIVNGSALEVGLLGVGIAVDSTWMSGKRSLW